MTQNFLTKARCLSNTPVFEWQETSPHSPEQKCQMDALKTQQEGPREASHPHSSSVHWKPSWGAVKYLQTICFPLVCLWHVFFPLQGFKWEPIQLLWVDFKCHFQERKIICVVHFLKLHKHYWPSITSVIPLQSSSAIISALLCKHYHSCLDFN